MAEKAEKAECLSGDSIQGEDLVPVAEVGLSEKPAGRSLSIQCSPEGSVECGTKVFAQGRLFYDSEACSRSWDSGMSNLVSGDVKGMIDNLRKEFRQEMKNLEVRLDKKSEELAKVTEERNELARKLDEERKENADNVEHLEKEKTRLETTVESLQSEVKKLQEAIRNTINHNASLEEQVQELQQRADASEMSSLNNMNPDRQGELMKLCAKIGNLMVVENSSSTDRTQLEADMSSASIQKASADAKRRDHDYKNGDGNGGNNKNGVPQQSVDPADANNQ